MSHIGDTSAWIKCVYCGSIKIKCQECNRFFHTSRKNHIYCSDRCRTRKSRKRKPPN